MPDLGARLAQVYPRITLTRALVALGVVLVAINIGSAIFDVRNARARTEDEALRNYANLTHLLAEQTAASLDTADLVLHDVMRSGDALGKAAAAMPRLREEVSHFPQIAGFMVLDRRGEVVARTEILRDAFGYEFDPGTNVIDVHLNHLRKKLHGFPVAIETVRGAGIRLVVSE